MFSKAEAKKPSMLTLKDGSLMRLDTVTKMVGYLDNLMETDPRSFLDLVNVCKDNIDELALTNAFSLINAKVIEKKMVFIPGVKECILKIVRLRGLLLSDAEYGSELRDGLDANEEEAMSRLFSLCLVNNQPIDHPLILRLWTFFCYENPLQSMLAQDEKDLCAELGLGENKWVVNDPDLKRCVLLAVTGDNLDNMELGSVLPDEEPKFTP